ncbi:hypothetical protein [Niveibacterium sp. SC-1]|uniref:hypothetical protein n=1 Tax=Niveibacterium sp. SC-1 TaxID=3135646 RepID=UPI00311D2F82
MKRLVQLLSAAHGKPAETNPRANMLALMRHRGRGWGLLAQYEEARLGASR